MTTIMYGSKYGVLWILLLVVLFVSIPLSVFLRRRGLTWWKILPVVTLSSLGVLVLSVIVVLEVTVRLAGDGASAPPPKPASLPDTPAPEVGAALRLGLAGRDLA